MYDFTQTDTKLKGSKEWLQKEFQGIRTGRATPSILDSVMVDAYGSQSPIKQVANVGIEDARTLKISPWDASLNKAIERGIQDANLGLGCVVDSSGIRIMFPQLTGERRTELTKIAKSKLEDARTAVRVTRDECWKDIQAKEEEGGMSEDEKFRLKDELQKKVDTTNQELEGLFERKAEEMQS